MDSEDLDVSLIVPSYNGESMIRKCAESIKRQTLPRSRYEVVLVINGPPDNAENVVREVFEDAPEIRLKVVYSPIASLPNARNLGIESAAGRWVTWVDVDDWLSPEYLAALVKRAAPGIVPLAKIVDVAEGEESTQLSLITEQLLALGPGIVAPEIAWRALGFSACKLINTEQARMYPFDVELKSGEDVAFFGPFMAAMGLVFDTRPAHENATYFRLVRAGSMSRQKMNFDFNVTQRLAVMTRLEEAVERGVGALAPVLRSLINSQALFINRYLAEFPRDFMRVSREVANSPLRKFPWQMIACPTESLAISYNFPPYADASGIVACKRLLHSGRTWNVVCNDMSGVRSLDPTLRMMSDPVVSKQKILHAVTGFNGWRPVAEFCEQGMRAIQELEQDDGPQRDLYSRSMWPPSHFLAALHKCAAKYDVRWTAEFSDPLSTDVTGATRSYGGELDGDLYNRLTAELIRVGASVPASRDVFAWCEHLPYALADEILFTNAHQYTVMISRIPDPTLRERVREVARIAAHPTPPAPLYQLGSPHPTSGSAIKHVAYFGSFYQNRGPRILLQSAAKLEANVRRGLRLSIFSDSAASANDCVKEFELDDIADVRPSLPYLDFLATASTVDCLVVSDADTAAYNMRLNPYLPSKVSDYAGTRRDIWKLVEPGSILSRIPTRYTSDLGDVESAARVWRQIGVS